MSRDPVFLVTCMIWSKSSMLQSLNWPERCINPSGSALLGIIGGGAPQVEGATGLFRLHRLLLFPEGGHVFEAGNVGDAWPVCGHGFPSFGTHTEALAEQPDEDPRLGLPEPGECFQTSEQVIPVL